MVHIWSGRQNTSCGTVKLLFLDQLVPEDLLRLVEQYDKKLDVGSSSTNQPQPRPTHYVILCYHMLCYVMCNHVQETCVMCVVSTYVCVFM